MEQERALMPQRNVNWNGVC